MGSESESAPERASSPETADGESLTLSTGETLELPLSTQATMLGATFSAPRERIEDLLPDRVRPIRATPGGNAAITFLSVEYHRIGDGEIDPYDEFAVVLPAIHGSTDTLSDLSVLNRATSGYMWYLPVTTEPAKALGAEIWGFPKVVADIDHEDDGSRRRTTVTVDDERFLTLEVDRPPSLRQRLDGYVYTGREELLRVPAEVNGELGMWPYSTEAAVAFGPHRRAEPLRELGIGGRALTRIAVDGEVRFHPGEPLVP